jgi:hypothetical protein
MKNRHKWDGFKQVDQTAFKRCVSRDPKPEELAILEKLGPLNAARTLLNLDETVTRE